jgi:hypothetical protein
MAHAGENVWDNNEIGHLFSGKHRVSATVTIHMLQERLCGVRGAPGLIVLPYVSRANKSALLQRIEIRRLVSLIGNH